MIIEIARFIRKPELKLMTVHQGTETEQQVQKLEAAVSFYSASHTATAMNIEAWGNMANKISQKFDKGDFCQLVGTIKQNKWQTETGENRTSFVIVVDRCTKLPRAASSDGSKAADESNSVNDKELQDYIAGLNNDDESDVPF